MVASIISAFGNGKDLLRRMVGKKAKRKGREPTCLEEEAWLRDSLHHRPLEIERAYKHNISRHGPRYEIGDTIAHTSLAHTLLTLNSGLIRLINQALGKDTKVDAMSRRALLSLSEIAASDTLNALSQLSLRLSAQSQLSLQAPPRPPKVPEKKDEQKTGTTNLRGGKGATSPKVAAAKVSKMRPSPSPLLVRGGWVRPKTSSVVSTSTTSSKSSSSSRHKADAAPRHQRSKSETALPKQAKKISPATSPGQAHAVPAMSNTDEHHHRRHRSTSEVPRPHRQPSMLIVPSDMFLPQSYLTEEPQQAPPRPPKIPFHTRPVTDTAVPRPNPSAAPRPKSSGTMRSASTKIGEIPDSRFPSLLQPVQEATYDPRLVEYIMSTPEGPPPEQQKERKRGKGFRFWKSKNEREESRMVAAY